MALQTSLFEQLKIEKITFEEHAKMYTVLGKITSYGTEEPIELYLHFSEINQILNQFLKNQSSTLLYDCLKSYETPDGKLYEMNIEHYLGYSIQVDMEYIKSFKRYRKCA